MTILEVFSAAGFSFAYPGAVIPALRGVTLTLRKGECVCVGGPSGCGKTTLLLALAGLLKKGRREGALHWAGAGRGSGVGLVFQNIESQILLTPVEDDVAFGPENMGFSIRETRRRVKETLEDTGLAGFEKRDVNQLSAGEKQRLGIASALAAGPGVLLLDEPTAQLDRDGKRKLLQILGGLHERGVTLLIAEHNLEAFAALANRYLWMEEGRITGVSEHLAPLSAKALPAVKPRKAPGAGGEAGRAVLSVTGLRMSGPAGALFRDLNLEIYAGEQVYLCGDNGVGKSTLLRCIAGLSRPAAGSIRIQGKPSHRPELLLGQVALLLQNPEKQLFEETVRREIGFSLLRMRLPGDEVESRVREAAALCGVAHLVERPPLSLSMGEQHRVALASVMAMHPILLLLDEPFAGIDFGERRRLLRLLTNYRDRWGSAVLIASHDDPSVNGWAGRRLELKGGRIEAL